MRRSLLALSVLSFLLLPACSGPRKYNIPVDSPLRPFTPPEPEAAPEDTPAVPEPPAPEPAAPGEEPK